MILRKADINDMVGVGNCHYISRRVSLPFLPPVTRDEIVDYFCSKVWGRQDIWVADEHDMIVGFVARTPGWLNHLYILPDYQGSGIGAELHDLAREGQDEMQLWAFQKNAKARRFYENRGWTVTKETDGADNMEKEPDVLYHWRRPG